MENNGLSEKDLHQQLNDAIVAGDSSKIDALMKLDLKEEVPAEPANPAEEPTEVVVSHGAEVKPEEVQAPKDDAGKEAAKPDESPDAKPSIEERDDSKPEPSAADRLRAAFSGMDENLRKDIVALFEEQSNIRKERDDYKHRFDSNAGRISAFQRTIADLQSQNSLLKAGQPPAKDADKAKNLPKVGENPHFKQLKEADPHLAETLEGVLEKERQSLIDFYEGRTNDTRNEILKAEQARYVAEQQQIVESYIPNIREVTASNEWKEWFEQASPGAKTLATSMHATDGLQAVELYTNWLVRTKPELFKQPEEQAKPEERKDSTVSKRVEEVVEARNRRLKATDVGGAPAKPAAALDVNDPDALHKALWDQLRPGFNVKR